MASPVDGLPRGSVTFLFTDIEGSTRLWDTFPDDMRRALGIHHEALTTTVRRHGGRVVKDTGDGMFAAFESAPDAVAAALDAQQSLAEADWPDVVGSLGVRMALHTAAIEPDDGDYHGPDVNLVARIEAAGHGGQILISSATASRIEPPDGVEVIDLGLHVLRGIGEPVGIHQVTRHGLPAIFPPLRTGSALQTSLPSFATSFVGRTSDIGEVVELIGEHRLVTLLGPGGIGKTRLGVEVARELAERTGVAAHFLGMASLTSVDQVVKALGDSIGLVFDIHISAQVSEKVQLFDRLRTQPLLVVLDNLEHLEEVGALIAEMVEEVPSLRVLGTSRRPLAVSSEWKYIVEGLAEPSELFVERTRQAGAEVAADDDVERLCDRLGGMPLAIELAAAWASLLSPAEIVDEVDRGLDFLESESADMPARHRSVRAVFDHSWRLLGTELQGRLARLAVFAAPFDREAAEAVTEASLRDLRQLVDRSLVARVADDHYALHPLLREFARERLGSEAEATWARYADHYAEFLLRHWPSLRGSVEQLAARDTVIAEVDHVRAVVGTWIATQPEERLSTLLMAANEFFFQHSWGDQKVHLEEVMAEFERQFGLEGALQRPSYRFNSAWLALADSSFATPDEMEARLASTREATEAGGGLAWFMWLVSKGIAVGLRGDFEGSLDWYERAAALDVELDPLSDVELSAWWGWSLLNVGRIEESAATFDGGLARATAAEHELGRAFLLTKYGLAADALGDHDTAVEFHHEGREIFVKRGDLGGQGYTLSRLSQTHYLKRDFDLARRYALEGLEKFDEMNHRWGIAVSLGRAGFAELELGMLGEAAGHFVECLDVATESGLGDQLHYGTVGIGRAALAAGVGDEALEVLCFEASAEGNPYADFAQVDGVEGESAIESLEEAVASARRLAARV